jgi:nitrite reductase (NADH) large subunit
MNVVVIGLGITGFTAARTIRKMDSKVKISVYSDENSLYYPRPRLYEVLSGVISPQNISIFSDEWYRKRNIKIFLNKRIIKVKTQNNELILEDHTKVNYDKLLLANGAHPFVPKIKGAEKNGVFTLRSIEDAWTIKEYARNSKKAIIIGGGLLGLEFAVSLRKLGQQVEIVELFPQLLPKQLDQEGAIIFKEWIENLDIKVNLGVKTEEILGIKNVSGILLNNGTNLSGDFVLISAGVRSNLELVKGSDIKKDKGIIVNQNLQTNINNVYAAGDVAEFKGKVYRTIPSALEQAKIAAFNIIGNNKQKYQGTPPLNTIKIIGIDLTSMGLVNPEGSQYKEIKKIDKDKKIYMKIILEKDRIVGAIILGDNKKALIIKNMMDKKINVKKYIDSLLEDNFEYKSDD